MGWKIVEINSEEHIRLYLNNLVVERPNGKITININDIDTLIIDNNRTNISIRLLNALSGQNVNTIIFNTKHEPGSYVIPLEGNHMSLKILEKQVKWTNQYKGSLWKKVIENKIFNQAYLLEKLNKNRLRIRELKTMGNKVEFHDITNREGHAAKVYWHTLFHPRFIRDQSGKQFPTINGMLNYGYTVLRGMVIRSIIKKGLDPRISLFHKSFTNFFALASDVMEPFRPIVDKIVYENHKTIFFDVEIREKIIRSLTEKVIIDGKRFHINNAIDQCVDQLVNGKEWKWVDLWD